MPARRNDIPELIERLPMVSLGMAAVSLLVTLVVQLGFASTLAEGRVLTRDAIDHVITHPSVQVHPRLLPAVRSAMPSFEGNEMFAFLRNRKASAEQSELDRLVSRAFDRLDSHPYRALGLVPAQGRVLAFVTYPFVHGGFIHALLTCALLLAVGPLLEVVWGRGLFGVACALGALFGAVAFRLAHADLDRALVGAGTLVSVLAAAALLRFWNEEVDIARWLAPITSSELRVPSWTLAAAWALYQAALVWASRGDLPGGLHNAQGLTASVAAAAAGAGIAFAYAHTGLEERFGGRPEPFVSRAAAGRFDVARVQRARAKGDLETAFQLLRAETRRSARNRDVVLLFWEIAVEHGQAKAAASAMLQLIREEMRRGALEAAVSQWWRLGERVPGALLEPPALLKLLPLIRSKLGDDAAALALHQAVDPANRGFNPEIGAEIVRTAAALEPEVAIKAASRALEAKAITPDLAAELRRLLAKLQPAEDEPGLTSVRAVELADVDDHDRSTFGAVDDLSADPEPAKSAPPGAAPSAETDAPSRSVALFPGARIAHAVPVALGDGELLIYRSGKGQLSLAYPRITAVSLAAVRGLGPKPVVLLDLLLSGPQPGPEPLSLVRLRSDQYDPRKLVASSASPLEALLAVVEELLEHTRAVALPDEAAGRGRPLRIFESLDAYSAEVLRIGSA